VTRTGSRPVPRRRAGRSSVLATTEHGMEHGHKHGGTRICRSATCTHVSHHTRQRRHRATLISHHCSHHRITGTGSHILIVYTTYTAVNDTIAVDPSRIPASARAHRGSGARLHRSPPHTHTAADRVGHPSTLIELVAVACTPERHARTPRTGVPPAHRRAPQLPLVGRPMHAYDVIHSATA